MFGLGSSLLSLRQVDIHFVSIEVRIERGAAARIETEGSIDFHDSLSKFIKTITGEYSLLDICWKKTTIILSNGLTEGQSLATTLRPETVSETRLSHYYLSKWVHNSTLTALQLKLTKTHR